MTNADLLRELDKPDGIIGLLQEGIDPEELRDPVAAESLRIAQARMTEAIEACRQFENWVRAQENPACVPNA